MGCFEKHPNSVGNNYVISIIFLSLFTYVNVAITLNIPSYPLQIVTKAESNDTMNTRAMTANKPIEIGKSVLTQNSCISDAIKIWNQTPQELQTATSLYSLKKITKHYARTLPI